MAVTNEQVTELYVAYFERAPDADGLAYWVNDSGLTIEQISQSFFDQPETQAKYPESMSSAEYIETIYQNVFDRSADAAGAVYWASELDSGNIQRSDMVMAVVNGAIDSDTSKDATILANKTAVGLDFAENGLNDTTQAIDVMSGVTAEADSVTEAKAKTDVYAEETFQYKLTSGVDNIVGSTNDDLIKGILGTVVATTTFTDGDVIDGGEGNDTLVLSGATDASKVSTTISNVENIELKAVTAATTLDAKAWTGVEKYTVNKAGFATTVEDVANTLKSVELSGATAAVTTTIDLADGLADSTVDVLVKNSAVVNTLDISDDSVEEYNLTSTGNSTGAGFTANSSVNLSTINVNGDSAIIVALASSENLEKIDASTLEAGLTYIDAALATDLKITGGTGANTITTGTGDDTITTGAGNDTITGTAGDNTIVTGDGVNSITTGGGDDTITGGAGVDTITTSGAGNDTIATAAGKDVITTGAGKNTINSGADDDTITAGGVDTIDAGAGNDTISGTFAGSSSTVVATINAGDGDDSISVGGGYVKITEAAGTDSLSVTAGELVVEAGTYSAINITGGTLDLSKLANNFTVSSVAGTLKTGSGEDTITMAAGGGTVDAGTSADIITGAGGTDIIDYSEFNATTNLLSGTTTATMDTINLFTTGTDKLKFGVANVDGTNADNDGSGAAVADYAAALASANALMDGTVIYVSEKDATNSYVFYDADGDGTADLAVTMAGIVALADGDIS